jgi:uncharacterized Tic20 family protein
MTANTVAPSPTQDERVLAALAHASALLPFMGIVGPIVIWVIQREKSAYVAFQALQALALQIVGLLLGFAAGGCYMLAFFGVFLATPLVTGDQPGGTAPGGAFALAFCILGLSFLVQALLVLYALVGAVMTLQGRPFRYIVVGDWLERFMATGAAEARGAAGGPGAGADPGAPG